MKTKLNFAVLAMAMLFVLAIPMSALALWDSPHEKADKLITEAINLNEIDLRDDASKKLKEAKNFLTKELGKNPGNTDALFVLARLSYVQGKADKAKKRFSIAYKKNPGLGEKIFNFYMAEAKKYSAENRIDLATKATVTAYQFQPQRKAKAVEEFFRAGASALRSGDLAQANLYFKGSVGIDSGANSICFAAYKNLLKQQTDPFKLLEILGASIEFANQRQTTQVVQFTKFVAHKLKEAKIQKVAVQQWLNKLPKSNQKIIILVVWPPTWKTVYGPVKFTGKGLEDKNWIKTVKLGKNCSKGDKVIIKGKYFEVYRSNGWVKYSGSVEITNKTTNSGIFLGVKAHKGEIITTEVKRFM